MRRKRIIKLLVLLVIVVVLGGFYLSMLKMQGRKAAEYTGDFKADARTAEDGKYQGRFDCFGCCSAAEVEFSVEGGEVKDFRFISLYNTPMIHDPEDEILKHIGETKNLSFDAVSGATSSSAFAAAAIKNALENGKASD